MSNHPIEIALAIALGGVVAVVAWLLTNKQTELATPTPVEITEPPTQALIPSMKLSHKQLKKMAQDHQIGSGKFRATAKKIELVTALRAAK